MDPIFYYVIFGVLIGFGLEFLFDWAVTRKLRGPDSDMKLQESAARSESEVKLLRAKLAEVEPSLSQIRAKDIEIEELKVKLLRVGANDTEIQATRELQATQSAEIAGLRANLSTQTERADRLERQLSEAEVFDHYSTLEKLDGAESEIGRLKDLLAQEEIENQDLSQRVAELSNGQEGHQGKIGELQGLLSAKHEEADSLAQRITELEAVANQANSNMSMLEDLQSSIAHKENAISALDMQIQEKDQHIQTLSALQPALDDLQTRVESYSTEVATLQAEQQSKDAHIAGMETRLKESDTQIQALNEKIDEHSALEQHILDLQKVLASKDDHIQEIENNVRSIETELAHTRAAANEFNALQATHLMTSDSLSIANTQVEDLEKEIASLRQQLFRSQEEPNESAISELSALRLKADILQRDADSLREVSASKDQAIAEARAALTTLESQLAFRPAPEEVQSLKATLLTREQEVADLTQKLEEALSAPVPQADSVPEVAQRPYLAPANRDALIRINGIGHLYERKLWEAGFLTYEDLATANPDQIFEIIQPAEWQRIEPDKWIAEAIQMKKGAAS